MTQHHCPSLLFLLPLSTAAACGSTDDAATTPLTDVNRADEALTLSGMVLHDTCGKLEPNECNTCLDEATSAENDCYYNCNLASAATGDFTVNCADTCESSSPSDICEYACKHQEKTQCQERAISFDVTTPSKDENYAACQAAVSRDEECDETVLGSDCDLYSRVESPDVVPTYKCLAKRKCGSNTGDCTTTLPAGDLVQRLSTACDIEVDPDVLKLLKVEQRWVLSTLQDDAMVCAKRYCGTNDYSPCLNAWVMATIGDY